ncbi:hypothetical protein K0M31_001553 [Melipona bicolor]|uniref:Uncharacterized protein n=1 Tax=Melipona bicolor TaxID=60889 RepID=A0AA40GFW1_9HYME|nr:hypothetical protein K0M31_001553 [Melipona bicolor]
MSKYGCAQHGSIAFSNVTIPINRSPDARFPKYIIYACINQYRAFRICVQHGWLSWRTGGLVLGLMSQAKQRSHVASYITTALCAGTFTCAAALIDVRLCINTSPPSRENPSCVLFNVSDTNAYCMCRMGNVNAKEAPIDRKTANKSKQRSNEFCNRKGFEAQVNNRENLTSGIGVHFFVDEYRGVSFWIQ